MYHFISQIFESENGGASSYVTFLKPVALVNPILRSHQSITSDVEFAFAVEQRSVYVFLTNLLEFTLCMSFSYRFYATLFCLISLRFNLIHFLLKYQNLGLSPHQVLLYKYFKVALSSSFQIQKVIPIILFLCNI
jgi:hypothetical protein